MLKSQKDACNCLYRANKLLLNNKLALNYHERVLSLNENLQIGKTSKTLQQMEYSQQKLRDSIAKVERLRVEDERIAKVEAATDRRHRIQYSFIFGFVFLIFGFVLISRKISISNYYVEGLIFFAFLMLFEFMLVLISPFISSVTNGEPAFILFCNAVLAGLIIPIHGFFEKRLKQKIKK